MTNTHINIGGYKVTTNKVGQVHTVTLTGATSDFTQYKVINGTCFLKSWNLQKTTTGSTTIATGLPPASPSFGVTTFGGNVIMGFLFVDETGKLSYDCFVANSGAYIAFSYPVSSGWVES